ncbi:MAG: type II toxin-antitoxin system VapC family toxin [Acidobacteria bacterium]|nr:type II toxin-antitoxin system VapC family toxin [Acidobacteriota bacterium]
MKTLLDTLVFLWAITDSPKLSVQQRDLFLDEANEVHMSVASLWEMLIQAGLGKLPLPEPAIEYLVRQMDQIRILLLPIRIAHLAELQKLPPLHRDPFDRMLVAQAKAEKMRMLSVDLRMREYGVEVIQTDN